MRAVTLEIDGSALADALSLVAKALRERDEITVDDAWLEGHGCGVKPYARFREVLVQQLDAARVGSRALAERRTLALSLTACGRRVARVELHLEELDRCMRFTLAQNR